MNQITKSYEISPLTRSSLVPKRQKLVLLKLAVAGALAVGVTVGIAAAQNTVSPPTPGQVTMGEDDAKKMVLLMDADKNGQVSREEFKTFMDAEFKRLDTDKSGEIDVNEMRHSLFTAFPSAYMSRK
jgi:hypothetical protein